MSPWTIIMGSVRASTPAGCPYSNGSLNVDTQPQGRANCTAGGFWDLTVYTRWYSLHWFGLLLWQNIMTKKKKKQVEEERVCLARYPELKSLEGRRGKKSNQAGTWRQGWTGCGGVLLTGLLPVACLAGFCIVHRITSLGMVKPYSAGPSNIYHLLRNVLWSCLQPNLTEAISQLRFPPLR